MQPDNSLSTTPKDSSASPKEKGVALSILLSDCDKFIFSDFEKMKLCLANMKQIIDPNDIASQVTFLHYSALFDNHYYDYQGSYDKFKEGLTLLDNIAIYPTKAEYLIDFVGTCMNLDKLEEASTVAAQTEQLLQDKPNELTKAKLLCRSGYLKIKLSQWLQATELLFEALNIFQNPDNFLSLKDIHFVSLIHSGLGKVYEKTNDPAKSKESYLKAIDICQKYHLNTRLAWHYLSAGNALAMLGEIPKAISYFKKALINTNDQNKNARAYAFANWGHCLFNEHLPDRALELYNKAEEVYLEDPQKNNNNLAIILKWKGQLFAQAKDYPNASGYFQKALAYAKKTNNYRELANICEATANLYASTNHFKIAYDYQLQKAEYEEQFAEQTNSKKIRELNIVYSSERKKQEIEKLRYQSKALQLKALRAQMNPHFLFNALNSIQNFITKNSQNEASTYLSSFAKLMRKSLDYSELDTISLEKEIDFLKHYLYINKHLRFRDRLEYEVIVSPDLVDNDYEIPSMIVQPYVENAIEHGLRSLNAGLIVVEFDLFDEDTIRCTISDNGIGRANAAETKNNNPELQLHKSKGTQITLDRLSMLNSRYTPEELVRIEDNEPNQEINCGTKVTVLIPV